MERAAGSAASGQDGGVRDVVNLIALTERLCLQEWLDNLDPALDPALLEAVWREAELPEPPR